MNWKRYNATSSCNAINNRCNIVHTNKQTHTQNLTSTLTSGVDTLCLLRMLIPSWGILVYTKVKYDSFLCISPPHSFRATLSKHKQHKICTNLQVATSSLRHGAHYHQKRAFPSKLMFVRHFPTRIATKLKERI